MLSSAVLDECGRQGGGGGGANLESEVKGNDRVSGCVNCVIQRMLSPGSLALEPLHIVRAGYQTLANMKHQVAVHNNKRMKEHNENILHEQRNLPLPLSEPGRTQA